MTTLSHCPTPTQDNDLKTQKLIQLESLRGIAAFVVFSSHFAHAFVPQINELQVQHPL
jgi:peptidoglycan/LPS O-acetylase OafA/YrhL